jgi:hypothetical protein
MRGDESMPGKRPGKYSKRRRAPTAPYRVRVPGFVTNAEIGLGDVIKGATSYVGIKPCGGCEGRAAAFDRWLVFGPGRGR